MKVLKKVFALSLLPMLLLFTAAYVYRRAPARVANFDTMYLLVPDGVDESNSIVREWLDGANEEGVHIALLHDSEFLNPMRQEHGGIKAIIVPDGIHRSANGSLTGALHEFVHGGGKAMVVYDAFTWGLDNNFTRVESRLSDLVGISYSMYEKYGTDTIHWGQVWGSVDAMTQLGIPPGKYVPANDAYIGIPLRRASQGSGGTDHEPASDDVVLTRYEYGNVEYPAFRTTGAFEGEVLLRSTSGVIAGVHRDGKGDVLFVNAPLGFLKSRTDGLMMHGFLRYFAVHMLGFPYLANVPDGIGGLVFNWHVDAQSAIKPIEQLMSAGIFDSGPYSVHFTAGPDVNVFNDGKGMHLDTNPEAQRIITILQQKGHNIGSHGGWIHNYFGEHLTDDNEAQFTKYLEMNRDSVERASHRKVTEYSAPLGNHPQWVSRWLEKNHVVAFYFTGDTAMSPTQVVRDATRDGDSIWSFPISHLGKYASLEEMGFDAMPDEVISRWLLGVADFTAASRTVRTIYTHPLGATHYMGPMQELMQRTRKLQGEQRFRWYTMTALADFLNARKNVRWAVTPATDAIILKATAPDSLAHETWVFSKARYAQPRLRSGDATIRGDRDVWLVTANTGKELTLEVEQH